MSPRNPACGLSFSDEPTAAQASIAFIKSWNIYTPEQAVNLMRLTPHSESLFRAARDAIEREGV